MNRKYTTILALTVSAVMFIKTENNETVYAVTQVTPPPSPIIEVIKLPAPLTVEQLVQKYATLYKVSSAKMMETIRCENRDLKPALQSGLYYQFSDPKRGIKIGERERSYGLVQIHLPDHPEVSYEQATDPEFSIEFMAKKFSQGRAYEWSCYK